LLSVNVEWMLDRHDGRKLGEYLLGTAIGRTPSHLVIELTEWPGAGIGLRDLKSIRLAGRRQLHYSAVNTRKRELIQYRTAISDHFLMSMSCVSDITSRGQGRPCGTYYRNLFGRFCEQSEAIIGFTRTEQERARAHENCINNTNRYTI
jgi:hypothetical protein